jgi:hypothetical protein
MTKQMAEGVSSTETTTIPIAATSSDAEHHKCLDSERMISEKKIDDLQQQLKDQQQMLTDQQKKC